MPEASPSFPGLTDSHIHPLMGTIRTQGADLFDATSLDDIRQRLLAERERVGTERLGAGLGTPLRAI